MLPNMFKLLLSLLLIHLLDPCCTPVSGAKYQDNTWADVSDSLSPSGQLDDLLTAGREIATAADVERNLVYFFGGSRSQLFSNFEVNVSSGLIRRLSSLGAPSPRYASSVAFCLTTRTIFLHAGATSSTFRFNDAFTYSPANDNWSSVTMISPNAPTIATKGALAAYSRRDDGLVIIWGGAVRVSSNNLFGFNATTRSWINLLSTVSGTPPYSLFETAASAVTRNNILVVFGAASVSPAGVSSGVIRYDIANNAYMTELPNSRATQQPDGTPIRWGFSFFYLPTLPHDQMVIVNGITNFPSFTTGSWAVDLVDGSWNEWQSTPSYGSGWLGVCSPIAFSHLANFTSLCMTGCTGTDCTESVIFLADTGYAVLQPTTGTTSALPQTTSMSLPGTTSALPQTTSMSLPSTLTDSASSDSVVGLAAGLAVGIVAFLGLLVCAAFLFARKRKEQNPPDFQKKKESADISGVEHIDTDSGTEYHNTSELAEGSYHNMKSFRETPEEAGEYHNVTQFR